MVANCTFEHPMTDLGPRGAVRGKVNGTKFLT